MKGRLTASRTSFTAVTLFFGAGLQGATDAAVIGPALLPPGLGDGRALIQRVGTPADVLQVGAADENGDQELEQLRLGAVHLIEGYCW